MKKLIFVFMVCFTVFAMTGCGARMATESELNNQKLHDTSMFVMVEEGDGYSIVYHRKTKVMYAVSAGTYNRGVFTVMLNADGKPMLWERE